MKLLIAYVIGTLALVGVGYLVMTKAPTVITETQRPPAGAVASPDIPSPYISYGNLRSWRYGTDSFPGAGNATSTLCAIQSPAATTTFVTATLRFATIPYSMTVDIAKSAIITNTTTRLAHFDVTSSNASVIATSTALTDSLIAPNSWINFVVSTTTTVNANFLPTGKCSLELREI